ncbi:filamentous hemagglutinin [Burkholderia sp. SG-MS1]|uniref:two-partner secretion domain-containing protein n=1 Tax=Paraburkholderia sp. SG-MS1 TaxID=2023741 RepID=UPI0014467A4A|nr:filamentous hemagglutinin N-terminal domain-containing protein [Paraburkholderia sp. SG-MS1]NKJ50665.1 filamentous hemagglutinin [Paraburkholderia sp. SG-MS1]
MPFRSGQPSNIDAKSKCRCARCNWILVGVSVVEFIASSTSMAGGVLPQGGRYVSGQGSITASGNGVVVTQPGSTRGVIEWDSFSIGKRDTVTFDNGRGGTLNRVSGGSPSAILGKLSATGDVFLINPQGIVIGRSGVIATGGRFLASTLNLCDDAFMKGDALTLSGKSDARVVNLGEINSNGGDVFLIARKAVVNHGTVTAPNGTVELAVGEQVLLQYANGARQVFVQTGSKGTIFDKGSLEAAQISLQAADGNIYALAGGGARLRANGTANRDGHVWLVADGGQVVQRGAIKAANGDGNGGTVDVQADQLTFGKDAQVRAGQWNISTPAWTIDASAANSLRRSLNAGTSVNVTTTGAKGTTGDLVIGSSLGWNGSAALTLAAYHNLSIASGIALGNKGTGNLTLRADATSIDNGGSVANHGTIDWSASTGLVSALYDMNGSYSPGTILTNAAWTAAPYSGLLTQVSAYRLVNSLTDLLDVPLDLSGVYALGKDLNLGGANPNVYSPGTPVSIGSGTIAFTGQFDGMGHVISGVTPGVVISEYGYSTAGLFGVIGKQGVVRNLGVTNVEVDDSGDGVFGIVAGVNHGLITYTYASGSIGGGGIIANPSIGGLVGDNEGTVTRSWSTAAVGSTGVAGGLVGLNGGLISQSYATGSTAGSAHGVPGGLVGVNDGVISQSYATGAVSSYPTSCSFCMIGGAGLVNENYGQGIIEQSFATGRVTQYNFGTVPIGIAYSAGGTIKNNVYWDKETTGATKGGGALPASNGLTTAQMSNPASFDTSWDFSATGAWAMPAGATHPVLRWQLTH